MRAKYTDSIFVPGSLYVGWPIVVFFTAAMAIYYGGIFWSFMGAVLIGYDAFIVWRRRITE